MSLSNEMIANLFAMCASSVHPDTLHSIAHVESRYNPYSIAEILSDGTVISHIYDNQLEAENKVNELTEKKSRFSVGLMQIYNGNFAGFNTNGIEMLDPCKNLKIAEKVISQCYTAGKTIDNALSCYYSGNFETGKKKERIFGNTSYLDRIVETIKPQKKYIVPSVKSGEFYADNTDFFIKEEMTDEIVEISSFSINEGKLLKNNYVTNNQTKILR